MSTEFIAKCRNFLILSILLPFVYGCQGGGGGGVSGVGPAGGASGFAGGGGAGGSGGGGADLATITNPEPTTMLLLGGGLMAMGYFKAKSSKC